MLLCTLLLQNCQPASLRIIDKDSPTETPLHRDWRSSASAVLTQPISRLPSPATAAHQPKVPPTTLSLPLLPGISPSAAFADAPSSMGIHASASMTPSTHILAAPAPLPPAAMPRVSHAAPLHNTPNCTSSSVFTSASGERVRFSQVGGQWQAALQRNNGSSASQRTLPVVGPADVGGFLSWLQGQDHWTSKARIHILHTPQSPYSPCVYLGKIGLLGGLPSDAEEDSKPSAQQQLSKSNERPRIEAQVVRSTALRPFGADEWKRYFGDVGSAPALPSNIDAILGSPCPLWPERKVGDTHLLVLIPATVDGAPFTLNLLEELTRRLKNGGHAAQYGYYDEATKTQLGEKSPDCSYWLLITREVLEGSRAQGYRAQRALVASYAKKTGLPYEIPDALEAATVILTYHTCTGEWLWEDNPDNPRAYTCCQEWVSGKYPAVLGSFVSSGFFTDYSVSDRSVSNAACCRKFNEEQYLQFLRVSEMTFGEKEWKDYFGDVGPVPNLPSDMGTILGSPCPFWPEKKVRDTHLLMLIPATVDGAPFTLNLLEELIQRLKNGEHQTEYKYYADGIKAQFGERSPDHSYWLLMTREVLEGSRGERYADQRALVASYAKKTGQPYEIPSALEAATAILLHHSRKGKQLFRDSPWTYTRCRELVDDKYPILVGGFEPSGLFVDYGCYGDYVGVVCCRKS
jgi:hypothetical protein